MMETNQQSSDYSWQLSRLYDIRKTATAGRTVVAKEDIDAAADVLCTYPSSPIAHVILQDYRREVCAMCFAYDRGRHLQVRELWPSAAVVFCRTECLRLWKILHGDVGLAALEAIEVVVKASQRRQAKKSKQDPPECATGSDASEASALTANDVNEMLAMYQSHGDGFVVVRQKQAPSEQEKRIIHEAANLPDLEIDTLRFLVSGILCVFSRPTDHSSNPRETTVIPPDLPTLEANSAVYQDRKALLDVCSAYLALVAILPLVLLPHTTMALCHALISRASHNAFSIRPHTTSDGTQSGEFMGWGIWPEASFFNHSCEPNIDKARECRRWRFWTKRDVEAGQELCITYLGGDEEDLTFEERRQRLEEHWGFWCRCGRCLREAGEVIA